MIYVIISSVLTLRRYIYIYIYLHINWYMESVGCLFFHSSILSFNGYYFSESLSLIFMKTWQNVICVPKCLPGFTAFIEKIL